MYPGTLSIIWYRLIQQIFHTGDLFYLINIYILVHYSRDTLQVTHTSFELTTKTYVAINFVESVLIYDTLFNS